jgi:peptidyl-prolyl cis-trans isomerase C
VIRWSVIAQRTAVILVVVLLGAGCTQDTEQPVVARVGDAVLTRQEVESHVDTTRGSYDYQVRNYIASWVNDELLFQEARRRGIDKSVEYSRQLHDVRRALAGQLFLQQSLDEDTSTISDDALRHYFENHRGEFVVREDAARLNLIVFSSRDRASTFAVVLARGASWEAAVQSLSEDSLARADISSLVADQIYTQRTLLPLELWRVATSLAPGDVSFPVKMPSGYVVMQLLALWRQGKPADFELVRDEVRQRLTVEQHQRRYADLLNTLRQQYDVEITLDESRAAGSTHRENSKSTGE